MNKNILLSLLIVFFVSSLANAQRWKYERYELSIGAGATNFLGELGGADQVGTHYFKDYEFKETHLALSIGMRYKLSNYFALKSHFTYGRISGNDALTNEFYRNYRNLNFFSDIYEFNVNFEGAFQQEQIGHRYRFKRVKGQKFYELYMYGFVGLGIFKFDPKTTLDGEVHRLRPLKTEGQGIVPSRRKYSLIQPCIPLGVGFKYTLNRKWGVGLELGVRKTFTDYIDDVSKTYFDVYAHQNELTNVDLTAALSDRSSQTLKYVTIAGQERGDPRYKDSYMFAIFTINYKMRNDKRLLPMF